MQIPSNKHNDLSALYATKYGLKPEYRDVRARGLVARKYSIYDNLGQQIPAYKNEQDQQFFSHDDRARAFYHPYAQIRNNTQAPPSNIFNQYLKSAMLNQNKQNTSNTAPTNTQNPQDLNPLFTLIDSFAKFIGAAQSTKEIEESRVNFKIKTLPLATEKRRTQIANKAIRYTNFKEGSEQTNRFTQSNTEEDRVSIPIPVYSDTEKIDLREIDAQIEQELAKYIANTSLNSAKEQAELYAKSMQCKENQTASRCFLERIKSQKFLEKELFEKQIQNSNLSESTKNYLISLYRTGQLKSNEEQNIKIPSIELIETIKANSNNTRTTSKHSLKQTKNQGANEQQEQTGISAKIKSTLLSLTSALKEFFGVD